MEKITQVIFELVDREDGSQTCQVISRTAEFGRELDRHLLHNSANTKAAYRTLKVAAKAAIHRDTIALRARGKFY